VRGGARLCAGGQLASTLGSRLAATCIADAGPGIGAGLEALRGALANEARLETVEPTEGTVDTQAERAIACRTSAYRALDANRAMIS
jgi:hypothetical protein